MKRAAALAVLLLLLGTAAHADALRLKNGKTKQGRILAENDGQILFQETDGNVSEVAASSVSIIDRAVVPGKAGQVSFFTTSPRKKKPPAPPPAEETAPVDASVTLPALEDMPKPAPQQDASLDNMDRMLQTWLEKHPDMKAWLETAAEKAVKKSAEMDDLLDQAKKQS